MHICLIMWLERKLISIQQLHFAQPTVACLHGPVHTTVTSGLLFALILWLERGSQSHDAGKDGGPTRRWMMPQTVQQSGASWCLSGSNYLALILKSQHWQIERTKNRVRITLSHRHWSVVLLRDKTHSLPVSQEGTIIPAPGCDLFTYKNNEPSFKSAS